MGAFSEAVDTLFTDPELAEDATYEPLAGGPSTVRAIARRPDETTTGFATDVTLATTLIDIRAAEVATPQPGDVVQLADGSRRVVQGTPRRADPRRLIWTLDTRPE